MPFTLVSAETHKTRTGKKSHPCHMLPKTLSTLIQSRTLLQAKCSLVPYDLGSVIVPQALSMSKVIFLH